MLSMSKKRFTVQLDAADWQRLRALAYANEVAPAVKARDLILTGLALAEASGEDQR